MEIFTEIEFNKEELVKIDEVLYTLGNEGWDLIHMQRFTSISKTKDEGELQAIKYKFRRVI